MGNLSTYWIPNLHILELDFFFFFSFLGGGSTFYIPSNTIIKIPFWVKYKNHVGALIN